MTLESFGGKQQPKSSLPEPGRSIGHKMGEKTSCKQCSSIFRCNGKFNKTTVFTRPLSCGSAGDGFRCHKCNRLSFVLLLLLQPRLLLLLLLLLCSYRSKFYNFAHCSISYKHTHTHTQETLCSRIVLVPRRLLKWRPGEQILPPTKYGAKQHSKLSIASKSYPNEPRLTKHKKKNYKS